MGGAPGDNAATEAADGQIGARGQGPGATGSQSVSRTTRTASFRRVGPPGAARCATILATEDEARPAEKSENYARSGGQGEEDATADGAKEKNPSSLPGKEAGKKNDEIRSLPEFRADTSTHVKGALGEGESSGLMFKGKPVPGKSTTSPEEVVASYRRQAEQELNSERVPEALKETIKNYFLSLGEARK